MPEDPKSSEERPRERKGRINRRQFIGAIGGAAAAAALLSRGAPPASAESSQVYYYQDSFGDVASAGEGAIGLGVYPPPVPSASLPPGGANPDDDPGPSGTTYYSTGYPKWNILFVIVDQMRNPAFWLPSGSDWTSSYANILPNITQLAQGSFAFPNYWVAATVCGPSRSCLLTGLYTQQTGFFKSPPFATGQTASPPLLPYNSSPNWSATGANNANPGFPTIGNVLSQLIQVGNNSSDKVSYDCTWIGKWHLSCLTGTQDGTIGQNGPYDYGFADEYCIPNAGLVNPYPTGSNGYPSPNGWDNEGAGGDFLDSNNTSARDLVNFLYGGSPPLSDSWPGLVQLNDAAIAYAFTSGWLPHANLHLNNSSQTPWFCAVSFINPHDITDFPWSYGFNNSNNSFGNNGMGAGQYFQPPPVNSGNTVYYGNNCGTDSACGTAGDVTLITTWLPNSSGGAFASLPPGAGNSAPWNWENLGSLPYSNMNNSAKPGLQLFFQDQYNGLAGVINGPGTYNNSNNSWSNPTGWLTFLNYYLWMQSCADYQVGQVLGTNPNSANETYPGLAQYPALANNTVVIFTADHGDYGGSHGLHAKGGGLYEEIMNVPLFVSYPSMRTAHPGGPYILPYVCSSVDILPFLYTLALGNGSWRTNLNDTIYYLREREDITDAIHQWQGNHSNSSPLHQRRISSILLSDPFGSNDWQSYQPFALHTADDYSSAPIPPGGSSNYQPCHAIAFRTVDLTDSYNTAAPFYGQNSYGGGKLGAYSYWNTCNQNTPPLQPISTTNGDTPPDAQYEFYSYSNNGNLTRNPQEIGNQYYDGSNSSGGLSNLGQLYYADFYNNSPAHGISVPDELYQLNTASGNGTPTQQVAAAILVAFQNYIDYLQCAGKTTGSNGTPSSCNTTCGNYSA